MKRYSSRVIVLALAVTALLLLLLTGCPTDEDDSVSISRRVNMFMDDVNGDNYGNLWRHMHPDSSAYTARRSEDTWTGDFPKADRPFTLGTLNIADDLVTTTITDDNSAQYNGDSQIFNMKEDGKDVWKILSMGGAVVVE